MERNSRAVLLALGAVLLWSTAASAFRLSLDHGSPWQVVMVASVASTAVFLAVVIARRERVAPKMLPTAALRGLLNPFLYYLVLLQAYSRLPAQVAMVVNYLWPLTLTLLAVPLLGQRLTAGALAGILVSFSGVVIMAVLRGGGLEGLELSSLLLAFGSTFIWALYWVLNTRASGSVPVNLLCNFCFGTLYLAVWGLLAGNALPAGVEVLAGGVYIGLFEMGLAFLLWNTALRTSDRASRVSGLIYVTPFLSLGVIALAVREPISPATMLGLLLVIAGIRLGGVRTRSSTATSLPAEPDT